jgi:cysteine synthase A
VARLRRLATVGAAGSVLDLIGNTPLVRLRKVVEDGYAQVLGKMESLNPSGSVKDRIARAMVEDAEAQGILRPGFTIVEATSGNSGSALAMVAAAKGYDVVIFMPENAPPERRRALHRYGAEVRLTPAQMGMDGSYQEAMVMAEANPECVTLDMFRNPAVVKVHRETTGQEIIQETQGRVDAFVAGVGTGGTLTGVGESLKEINPSVRIVAVEPASSQVLSHGLPGPHAIPGIGADFVPPLLNRGIIDEILPVTDEAAAQMSLRLAREEGLQVGISSGANVAASRVIARRLGVGKTVVTVLPDTGERYLAFPL